LGLRFLGDHHALGLERGVGQRLAELEAVEPDHLGEIRDVGEIDAGALVDEHRLEDPLHHRTARFAGGERRACQQRRIE
jgi:hypothetical protein